MNSAMSVLDIIPEIDLDIIIPLEIIPFARIIF